MLRVSPVPDRGTEGVLELPPLHSATSDASLDGQREFLLLTATQLGLLMLAAITAVLTIEIRSVDIAQGASALCFLLAIGANIALLTRRPDRRWYEGRAAAESVKTLSWRYSVGAEPFLLETDPNETDTLFVQRLDEILGELPTMSFPGTSGPQITESMRHLRLVSLEDRRRAYETLRIRDQETWYSDRAKLNERRSRQWTAVVVLAEMFGAVVAVGALFEWFEFDVVGIAAAAASAATAWLRSKQHEELASAYSLTAQELGSIHSLIGAQDSDEAWSKFVTDAEEAISREHTMWRASRGVRRRRS
jgi:hypothetical protein